MRRPLTISALRKIQGEFIQSQYSPVCISDICWNMHPYVTLHDIRLTETAFLFTDKNYRINFNDVIRFNEFCGTLEILLRNGSVYLLAGDSSEKRIINLHYKDKHPVIACWYIFLAGIQLNSWRLKNYIHYIVS